MAKSAGKHGAKRSRLGSAAVFVVLILSGYLLMTNLRVNRSTAVTSDTAELVEQRVGRVRALQDDVKELSSQIATLNTITAGTGSATDSSGDDAGSNTILPAVEGPGITVTLDDSPLWRNSVGDSGSSSTIDYYVIHQEDIEAVVNALWKGGAESMMIQDQRVLFNSAVQCAGNVLVLQGKQYSPPYTISAIGDPDELADALAGSPGIQIYKQYVRAYGLGWDVETKDNQRFPQSALLQPLQYATVPKSEGSKQQ
ncbi:DUF881 domain-containing protein [Bifidobacterium sp.]|uniref:DUF881 domain-containing protein n=1 Tax=Bifidobacterium sp. TaxID=41200 RepID=UPI0025BED3BD|nr:DUF881 domain-containing protein [Bifidobacterium sp.]MCH4209684.1 DUF881 domain-containing protein [Bifidobacterium sp.]